ncbi:MAG: hypothetical protein R3300_10350 [Candidatus Promineifilaceae bacterium]|nr:hypothetical protein [Candidatus Promineifilaceae bacterium]
MLSRLSRLLFVFGLLFSLFLLLPPVLGQPFGPYPLVANADVFDLLTPVVLLPLYWLLFRLRPDHYPGSRGTLYFMALAGAWAMGQGMHLAANSIGHLVTAPAQSDLARVTHFYDEDLSHFIWHGAIIGLMVLLLARQWRLPFAPADGPVAGRAQVLVGALLYGLTFGLAVLEAGTAVLGVPAAVGVVGFWLGRGRGRLDRQPLLRFFVTAMGAAVLLFAVWFVIYGGLPEPSAVGLIE